MLTDDVRLIFMEINEEAETPDEPMNTERRCAERRSFAARRGEPYARGCAGTDTDEDAGYGNLIFERGGYENARRAIIHKNQ